MGRSIEVTWKKGQFAGYKDVFPVEEFGTAVKGVERVHLIRGPKGGKYSARYRLDVQRLTARLDYEAFAEFNERHGIELEHMEFRFTTVSHTEVRELLRNGRIIPPTEASVVDTATNAAASMSEVVASQQQALARQRLRPGQAKFRHILDLVYPARCCVSGCTVPWAVDAAHIAPYKDKQSSSATNGLLLRSDLHALFDGNQLAVHPMSRFVYFSPQAREWGEYRALHGTQKLRRPQPGFAQHAPGTSAFGSRWKLFVREHDCSPG